MRATIFILFLILILCSCQKIQVDYALTDPPTDAPEYSVEAEQFPKVETK